MTRFALLLIALNMAPGEGLRDRAHCSRECISCTARCRLAPDLAACKRTCLEMKRACCTGAEKGPGPNLTCSCT